MKKVYRCEEQTTLHHGGVLLTESPHGNFGYAELRSNGEAGCWGGIPLFAV